ncbi:O-antigen ligase family protein [Streptomyces sp. 3N207]|uniref:O-antigen ligase family protein n=1 Tax=Streptomyces sp. 3N207 TaxID=3457417 RepID=UPI003FD46986
MSAATGSAALPSRTGGRTPVGRLARIGPSGPAVPVVVTVLLLCAPADRTSPGAHSGMTLADICSGVLVVWCALGLLRDRAIRRTAGRSSPRALTPLAALVLGAPAAAFAVTTIASADPAASLPGFVRYLQLFVLVPGAVLLSLRNARDARLVCAAVVLLALIEGAVGVVQALTGTGASYQGENVRAVGTFGALDVMGMATAVSYGLVTALACGLHPPTGAPRWLRPCALGCAAVLVVPLALSYSRGAWIATALAALLLLVLRGARTTVCVLAAVVAAGVVLVGGFGVATQELTQRARSITEVSNSPDRSVTDRYSLWGAAVDIWRQAPATGVGPKGFPEHRDAHAALELSSGGDAAGAGTPFQREPLLSPHNMYLLVLSEQGLVGTVALLGSWGALLVCSLRRLRGTRRDPPASRAADCGAVAAGLLVWQGVEFLYGDIGGPSTVLTALVLGLATWWALSPVVERDTDGSPSPVVERDTDGSPPPVVEPDTDGSPAR